MSLLLRSRLIVAGAIAGAIWLAWELASGNYLWPALVSSAALGASLVFLAGVSLDRLVLGALLFGYLVGNRGFAQLMPTARLPLLPAEIGLVLAGGWMIVQSARARSLPFRRDLLNAGVLAWLIVGTGRVLFDVKPFGFVALRDYAMVYYAAFFFIAQQAVAGNGGRFLLRILVLAAIAQPIAAVLVEVFPEFFLTTFAVRGVPLIYFKGDLALTFTAVSAFVLLLLPRGGHRLWAWPLATAELLYVIGGDNRASMLGALTGLAWLALSRVRRLVWSQAAVMAIALFVLAAAALIGEQPWARQKFHGLVERFASLTDFSGRGSYSHEESGVKGDNNRFRAVWWRTVIDDTLDQNPLFGLGFGYDLARNFLREYNPDMAEDFTARSPHSIVISAFGRMGFVGLIALLAIVAVLIVRTWRVMREPGTDPTTLGLWACVWVIFVSACFGVVLEGPMGAVVFWILLGRACAVSRESSAADAEETSPNPAAALQPSDRRDELAVSQP
jgi:O-antigen ligase